MSDVATETWIRLVPSHSKSITYHTGTVDEATEIAQEIADRELAGVAICEVGPTGLVRQLAMVRPPKQPKQQAAKQPS